MVVQKRIDGCDRRNLSLPMEVSAKETYMNDAMSSLFSAFEKSARRKNEVPRYPGGIWDTDDAMDTTGSLANTSPNRRLAAKTDTKTSLEKVSSMQVKYPDSRPHSEVYKRIRTFENTQFNNVASSERWQIKKTKEEFSEERPKRSKFHLKEIQSHSQNEIQARDSSWISHVREYLSPADDELLGESDEFPSGYVEKNIFYSGANMNEVQNGLEVSPMYEESVKESESQLIKEVISLPADELQDENLQLVYPPFDKKYSSADTLSKLNLKLHTIQPPSKNRFLKYARTPSQVLQRTSDVPEKDKATEETNARLNDILLQSLKRVKNSPKNRNSMCKYIIKARPEKKISSLNCEGSSPQNGKEVVTGLDVNSLGIKKVAGSQISYRKEIATLKRIYTFFESLEAKPEEPLGDDVSFPSEIQNLQNICKILQDLEIFKSSPTSNSEQEFSMEEDCQLQEMPSTQKVGMENGGYETSSEKKPDYYSADFSAGRFQTELVDSQLKKDETQNSMIYRSSSVTPDSRVNGLIIDPYSINSQRVNDGTPQKRINKGVSSWRNNENAPSPRVVNDEDDRYIPGPLLRKSYGVPSWRDKDGEGSDSTQRFKGNETRSERTQNHASHRFHHVPQQRNYLSSWRVKESSTMKQNRPLNNDKSPQKDKDLPEYRKKIQTKHSQMINRKGLDCAGDAEDLDCMISLKVVGLKGDIVDELTIPSEDFFRIKRQFPKLSELVPGLNDKDKVINQSADALKVFLRCVFSASFTLPNWETVLEAYAMATKYQAQYLQCECVNFTNHRPIPSGQVQRIIQLAEHFQIANVLKSSQMFADAETSVSSPAMQESFQVQSCYVSCTRYTEPSKFCIPLSYIKQTGLAGTIQSDLHNHVKLDVKTGTYCITGIQIAFKSDISDVGKDLTILCNIFKNNEMVFEEERVKELQSLIIINFNQKLLIKAKESVKITILIEDVCLRLCQCLSEESVYEEGPHGSFHASFTSDKKTGDKSLFFIEKVFYTAQK